LVWRAINWKNTYLFIFSILYFSNSIILEMKKLETCHHCGEEKEDCYHGFIAMTLPIPEAEADKQKWGGDDWWKNLEREDLTQQEFEQLDNLNMYDQLLNTVGRGVQCEDCGRKEQELYEKYYPKSL
jgi:hypothetical protein